MAAVLRFTIIFLQHAWGTIHRPYETFRRLAKGENIWQVIPLFMVVGLYFLFATVVQKGLHTHPLFLTFNAGKLVGGFIITFLVMLVGLAVLGRLGGGKGTIRTLFLPWCYSLLPTLTWFIATSIFYVLLPPPRTPSLPGQIFSFVFLIFSFFLFFWKFVLYYLTLRFGMRLTFLKIVYVSIIFFPLAFGYSILMYRAGIFKVPFI